METFVAELGISLKLTIDGTAIDVHGSFVRHVSAKVTPYGYEARVVFWQSLRDGRTDAVFTSFITKALAEVELTVSEAGESPVNVVLLKGIVTEKRLTEVVSEAIASRDVLFRIYEVTFRDPARVLWGQHFPCDLHVDANLAAVIDAHKGAKITITYDWPFTQTAHPIHFLPLGSPGNDASFYDFIAWVAHTYNGVLTYDSATNAYKLSESKAATGTAVKLPWATVAKVETTFPETARHQPRVLNSYATSTTTEEVTADQKVAGVTHDHLVRTSVASQATDRKTLETARLILREHEVCVVFKGLPSISLLPGALVDFSHEYFGTSIFQASKTYRVRELRYEVHLPGNDPTNGDGFATRSYETGLEVDLELQAEKHVPLPPFRAPRWPAFVEGLVVSETGEEAKETYQIYPDSNTSIDQYKVKVPLFKSAGGEPLVVVAPYEPNTFPGHFYFPAFKGSRVLLALDFRGATIDRFLAWRAGARLPADGQGNHLLLGLTDTSKTSISHAYVDNKPVLTVNRVEEKDTELVELKDGTIVIQTKEES